MIALEIRHRTAYSYRRSVSLRPHRLMLRPRESREPRLRTMALRIAPEAMVSWAHDVAGNLVATASFAGPSDRLVIESRSIVELDTVEWPVFAVAASAITYPFRYADDAWIDLGALAAPGYPDPAGRLRAWTQAFVRGMPTDTLSLLKDINAGVAAWIAYQEREDEGTQSPVETLDRGWGSCRDMAVLFVEAVRTLQFGARIVSGYLHNPQQSFLGSTATGPTAAWAAATSFRSPSDATSAR